MEVAFIFSVVAGCASTAPTIMRWTNNNNATQDQWMKDRYACYSETQQRISGATVNQSGGNANSIVIPMCSAFNACLAARGYVRSDATGTLTIPEGAVVQCAKTDS
jgi:hypothetical protein